MLRQELPEDYKDVEKLVYSAFESASLYEFKDVTEHKLVAELRNSESFIPELSLVVQEGWEIVGHIICLKKDDTIEIKLMSVLPVLQKTGVGLQLVLEARDIAKKMGFKKLVVKSDLDNFKKYGFTQTNDGYELNIK